MGGKMKRQDTASSLRSTSLRRDSVSPATTTTTTRHHVKTVNVGCMSGILQLVSKYHTRRKFLTFGKKQEKQATPPPKLPKQEQQPPSPPKSETITSASPSLTKLSLEVTRSPAIPSQIRISSGSSNSPRVVARLMGLEDNIVPASPSSAAEKRRKLLGALEKCDEDLKALKRIIEAVRKTSQTPPPPPLPPAVVVGGGGGGKKGEEREDEDEEMEESEEPSPVSVLDHHYRLHAQQSSPLTGCSKRTRNGQVLQQQQQQKQAKQQQRQQIIMTRKKPGEEDNASLCFLHKPHSPPPPLMPMVTTTSQSLYFSTATRQTTTASSSTTAWRSAMKDSVTEVCKDIAWGQRREVGRIALLIQDFIYKDLVEEIIKDFGCFHVYSSSPCNLPHFEASKRKLCF